MLVVFSVAFQQRFHSARDVVGAVVKRGIQTLKVDMAPAIGFFQCANFACKRTAGDDQNGGWHRLGVQALCASRRSPTSRAAVLAASAASRQ